MTDMIERVARAICRAYCPPTMSEEAIQCQVDNGWDMWVNEAIAAIKAMRKPTDEMVDAGWHSLDRDDDVTIMFNTMIGASLGENK